MATKELFVFVVEGDSEEQGLGLIMSRLLNPINSKFIVICGDITTKKNINTNNICKNIKEHILCDAKFLQDKIEWDDITQIIHLVDSDGVYIPESEIVYSKYDADPVYCDECIMYYDIIKIRDRNRQKKSKR